MAGSIPFRLDGPPHPPADGVSVKLAVDSDGHRAERLGRQMRHGVTMARRGWIEPHQVVNTRPCADVRRLMAAKRAR